MTTPEYPIRDVTLHSTEDNGSSFTGDKISPSIDDAMLMDNVWDRHLTHQTRVLLCVEPLLRVLRSDENRSEELEHYDSLALALKLLDHIVTHSGLEHEADSDTAMRELLPLMEAMDQAASIEPDIERQIRMAKIVLGALRNDKEGLRPFKRVYTDFASGYAIKRELAVRLIEERYTARGDIVLHLSNEATNLLLNALAHDIEDEQAAAEAIVQSQLARGHLQDAISTARAARLYSSRLREKIERLLTSTRRDLSRVDWKQEVPRILSESLKHLESRCDVEHNIIKSAREKQDALTPGSEEAYYLTTLILIISDCRQCHMELQLMEAPQVFLDEQERQVFAIRRRLDLPDMLSDVLTPLLSMRRVVAAQALPIISASCFGVRAPNAFTLTQNLQRLLQPRREPRPETVPVAEWEPIAASNDQLRYTRDVYERTENYLNTLQRPVRLAYLLQQALEAGESELTLEVILFSVLRHFDPYDVDAPKFLTIKIDDEQFFISNFYGDNVLICDYAEERKDEKR
jgi:hypothetical protein